MAATLPGVRSSTYHAAMSFVAILIALLLEQARPVTYGNAIHMGAQAWVDWCGRNFDVGKPQHAWLAWCFAVLVPALLCLLVYWLLVSLAGWPFGVLWSIVVLYFTLGFRQFSHHFTEIRDALEAGDEVRARQLLAQWRRVDANGLPGSEIVRQVVEHSVISAHRHVFGVLAWFSVLAALGMGPVGAVVYRMSEFVPRYWKHRNAAAHGQPVSAALQDVARQVWHVVDWLPARITAIGFAVVGSFEDAIDNWRSYERREVVDNDGVILASTAGAIDLQLGPLQDAMPAGMRTVGLAEAVQAGSGSHGQQPVVGHLRIVVGLVWRSVVMWMILLALLSLARLIG